MRSFLAIKRCQKTKSKKVLSNHEAHQKVGRISAPIAVKLLGKQLVAMLMAMAMQMEHIQCYTLEATGCHHWGCIAQVTAMVNEFVETTQNTNKTQILASNYGTNQSLVVYENFMPQNEPSSQFIDVTSPVKV